MITLKKFLPYFRYLKPVRGHFILGILFGFLFSISSGFGIPVMIETVFPILFGESEQAPEWLQSIVEQFFSNNVQGGFLIICSLLIPLMVIVRAVASWGNGFFMNYTGFYLIKSLQKALFDKIQTLPYSFFKENKTGEISASILAYPEQIKRIVVDMSNDILKQPLTLVAAISFLVYKSASSNSFFIAVIGFLSVPILVFPIRMIGSYLSKRSKKIVQNQEALASWTIETIQSPIEIRSFNLEERQKGRFHSFIDQIFTLTVKSIRTSLLISPSIEFVSSLGFAFALYLGVQKGMSQGEFLALFIALYMAYSPIKRLGQMHGLIKQIEAPLNRVERIMNLEESVKSPTNPVKINKPIQGHIDFEEVSFFYEEGKPILESVSKSLKPGEPFILTGESGSGKSTFVNLIMRLYDPSAGIIKLDGVDLKDYDLHDLRQQIAYVPQMPLLFNCSVMENIRIGKPNASDEAVYQAAKDANAYKFINDLSNGFDTVLSEKGSSLSGGQRQRIAIARAILKDAPIMIFDEATSALDKDNKHIINIAIGDISSNKTIISITHM